MKEIKGLISDEERALYHLEDTMVRECAFYGPRDGESCLKECRGIILDHCDFQLRYPIWHAKKFQLKDSHLHGDCRASLWYCSNGKISNNIIDGVKALRECKNIKLVQNHIISPEFGWKCSNIKMEDNTLDSVYAFFDSRNLTFKSLDFVGKYSFQYTKNIEMENCVLDTKDAFWHSKNVTVKNSVIKGEYLAWYSENLTLINCKIIGTQPLCYCKNLTLIDCTMEQCDLSFEYSDVHAKVIGHIDSVKNPRSGKIIADSISEIILENSVYEGKAKIVDKSKKAGLPS